MMHRVNIKRFSLVILLMAFLGLNAIGCAKAEFTLNSLNITPERVTAGDSAIVSISISNNGKIDGIYTAVLTIDGETAETKDIEIPAGSTEIVNFKVTRQEIGSYEVGVGGLKGLLIVVKPPVFQLSSLDIKPAEIILGKEVNVTVSVRNNGDVDGIYKSSMLVDGVTTQTKETIVPAGVTVTVSFSFIPVKMGSYSVSIGELSQNIKVLTPAEFQLTDLKISPIELLAHQPAVISLNIRNIGEVEGLYKIGLLIDTTLVEMKDVIVSPNQYQSVQFDYIPITPGSFKVTVSSLKEITGSVNSHPAYEIVTAGELSSTLTVLQRTVLVDASKDGGTWWFPQTPPFDSDKDHQGKRLADYLRSLGYEVTELPRGYRVSLDLLQKYDFVIRDGVFLRIQSYTPDEITAYQEYVRNGGKLLLMTPGLRSTERDPLSESFGLVFAGITAGTWGRPRLGDHPMFSGGKTPALNLGGSGLISYPPEAQILGWLAESAFLDIDGNKLKDSQETWGPPALGVITYGKGTIVFEGQFAAAEMPGFIGNIINWLAEIAIK